MPSSSFRTAGESRLLPLREAPFENPVPRQARRVFRLFSGGLPVACPGRIQPGGSRKTAVRPLKTLCEDLLYTSSAEKVNRNFPPCPSLRPAFFPLWWPASPPSPKYCGGWGTGGKYRDFALLKYSGVYVKMGGKALEGLCAPFFRTFRFSAFSPQNGLRLENGRFLRE